MTPAELKSELDTNLQNSGATFVAVAGLTDLPTDIRAGLPTGICIGLALDPGIIDGIAGGPTAEYADEYNRANALLEQLAEDCATFLRGLGYRAEPRLPSENVADRVALSTPLPHKTVATLSGVGWIGRCALLVTREWGSAVRYNTVLTDAPLPAGEPVRKSFCGKCRACVDACPADAPGGVEWRIGMEREELFDALACRDCEARIPAGDSRYVCGICIAACPHTQRYIRRNI